MTDQERNRLIAQIDPSVVISKAFDETMLFACKRIGHQTSEPPNYQRDTARLMGVVFHLHSETSESYYSIDMPHDFGGGVWSVEVENNYCCSFNFTIEAPTPQQALVGALAEVALRDLSAKQRGAIL